MRRFLFLIGFLFLPQSAGATALSPWVQGVIDRADAGITAASGLPTNGCDFPANIQEIRNNLSVVRDERNLLIELGIESQFLRERTLCFESDRRLLQAELRKVYDALSQATATCNLQASTVLRLVYEFTLTAYRSFLRGSVDASYEDNRLRLLNPFGGGTEVDPNSTAPLCPYTTDYSPHFIGQLPSQSQNGPPQKNSYGCDADVLAFVRDGLPPLSPELQTEASDLISFMEQTNSLASDIATLISQALYNIDSTIAILTGAPPPDSPSGSVSPPPHASRSGCLRPPSPEGGSPQDFDAVLAAFPDFFRPENLGTDAGTGAPTYSPSSDLMIPIGTLFRPSYDSFFTLPNALILSRAHADRKAEIGNDRPLPSDLVHQDNEGQSLFMYVIDESAAYRATSSDTERFMSMSDAILRDSYERNLESVFPLDSAVQALSGVTENFLPSEYIPALTYFLRRSCVDGHCNTLLDAVAKRAFNPYCHPYVSGKYTDERVSDKCFCTSEFDGESYCSGGDLHLSEQPPAQLQCGEATSAATFSNSSSQGFHLFTF